ncbi:hypothetical protein JCM18899A_14380 [Nocardioides sp. AN3]
MDNPALTGPLTAPPTEPATALPPGPGWTVSTMRRVAAEESIAVAALRYANLGIPVFPCTPGGKQPLTPNGFHDASSSARVVHAWWQRTPEANIGLPTGAASGVLVVDVDVHPGGNGFAAFERARATDLAEGWGWLVRTPSGGVHAYYPTARDVEQRSWQVPSAHVDFRGDGGYVIAPPSRIRTETAATAYTVIAVAHHQTHPVDAVKLRQFLEPPRRLPPPTSLPAVGANLDRLADWVTGLQEGERNHGLFWAACRAVETGHRPDQTLVQLGRAGLHIGLPQREIETTIRSAYRTTTPSEATSGPGSAAGTAARGGSRPTQPSQGMSP